MTNLDTKNVVKDAAATSMKAGLTCGAIAGLAAGAISQIVFREPHHSFIDQTLLTFAYTAPMATWTAGVAYAVTFKLAKQQQRDYAEILQEEKETSEPDSPAFRIAVTELKNITTNLYKQSREAAYNGLHVGSIIGIAYSFLAHAPGKEVPPPQNDPAHLNAKEITAAPQRVMHDPDTTYFMQPDF